MAEDRTCLDCIAQYSHLPVKLCEEHADERRAGDTRMTPDDLWRQAMDKLHAARQRADAAWRTGDLSVNEANLAFIEAKEAALLAYNAAQEKPE